MSISIYDSKLEEALTHLQCELVAERNRVNTENISWFQYDILEALYVNTEILPAQLSLNLGVTRSKMSKGLKALKEKGYVFQEKSMLDSRNRKTALTEKGIRFLKDVKQGHAQLADIVATALTKQEQEVFILLSTKVSNAIAKGRQS